MNRRILFCRWTELFIAVWSVALGWRIAGDVYVRRSEEILQRNEETRLQAATETDTETAGLFLPLLNGKHYSPLDQLTVA